MNLDIYLTIKYDSVCSDEYIDDQNIYNRETCKLLQCHQIGKHKISGFFSIFPFVFPLSVNQINIVPMVKIGGNKSKQ